MKKTSLSARANVDPQYVLPSTIMVEWGNVRLIGNVEKFIHHKDSMFLLLSWSECVGMANVPSQKSDLA